MVGESVGASEGLFSKGEVSGQGTEGRPGKTGKDKTDRVVDFKEHPLSVHWWQLWAVGAFLFEHLLFRYPTGLVLFGV